MKCPAASSPICKEQARSLGLETRWHEVAKAYRAANDLFGDIVKVTPSSKVVGDMALMMVAQDLTSDDVLDPKQDIAFPASVVEMLRGDLGQPLGGWPKGLQAKVLKDIKPITDRPGALLPATDLDKAGKEAETKIGRPLEGDELLSYLMYPKVFADIAGDAGQIWAGLGAAHAGLFLRHEARRGDRRRAGARQVAGAAPADHRRDRRRGQGAGLLRAQRPAPHRQGSQPLRQGAWWKPGARRKRAMKPMSPHPCPALSPPSPSRKGEIVKAGDVLLTIEAMKMETALHAPRDGTVSELLVTPGAQIDAKDLLVVLD